MKRTPFRPRNSAIAAARGTAGALSRLCLIVLLILLACGMPHPALAQDDSWQTAQNALFPEATPPEPAAPREEGILPRFGRRLSQVWHSSVWDLYLPFYMWHNRLMYDDDHIRRYNETPWGGGLGKSFMDEDGDRHFLYAMSFQDSHNRFEPIIGYAFQKNWRLDEKGDWRAGLGYTMAITAREQYDYIPLPLILPLAGLEYKRLAVQGTYIPGTRNNGNVLFLWARWQLTAD